jgi:hypothetical protein
MKIIIWITITKTLVLMTKNTILENINEIEFLYKLIKEDIRTMNSITQFATASQVLDGRRNERLRIGRTADELREYLDKFFTSLTPDNKSELVQIVTTRESSFTHLEEMVFKLYH